MAGATFREILIDSRSAKCCIFPYKMRLQDGTSKVSEAVVRDDDFIFGYVRIIFESSLKLAEIYRDFPLTS